MAELALPPRLERYLPPYLWQKLREDPRRGTLLNVLDRLRSVLYLVSTYLPGHLVQEALRLPQPGQVRGQLLHGTLLFSDVSGFTALSERLAEDSQREGALAEALARLEDAAEAGALFEVLGDQSPEGIERLTANLNRYFDRMLGILSCSGGILVKFAGDALLAYFPVQESGEQARWATRAGQRMMAAMAEFAAIQTSRGPVALRMKVGIASGSFLGASVGTAQRMEYVVLGETVSRTLAAEGAAEAGLVVADEATAQVLGPDRTVERAPGFYAVSPLPEAELGAFEISADLAGGAGRRARSTAPWIASTEEVLSTIGTVLQQVDTLVPYLPALLVERIVASAEQRRLESDFRPAAVMFANLLGLEELLAAGLDVETVTAVLNDCFQAVQTAVDRYGGVLSRIDPYSKGSKMLVLFGAPVAHEDDPQRATRAALAMMESIAALDRRWRPALAGKLPPDWSGPLLRLRAGITQGMTFAGLTGSATRREYTVMGDEVNLAARLMSAACPGQVLLAESIYQSVAGDCRVTALPPVQVKGKTRPVPLYQLDGLREDRLARRLRTQGAFVGRAAELARLRATLEETLAGRGALLTIAGPAGVGKSRLTDALVDEALSRGARAWLCECAAYTAEAPYAPWISLVESIAGIVSSDVPGTRSHKLLDLLARLGLEGDECAGPLLQLLGLPADAAPRVARQPAAAPVEPPRPRGRPSLFDRVEQQVGAAAGGGLDLWKLSGERRTTPARPLWQRLEARVVAREQVRLFGAVEKLLQRLSAEVPVLLLLEGTQWLDATSRELLEHLGERLAGWPLLVLLLQRTEAGASPEVVRGSQVLLLEPLRQEETRALLGQLLGEAEANLDRAALAQAVYEQSAGNPLFVEEVARLLLQAGAGQPAGAGQQLPAAFQRSGTLRELVLGRVDRLPQGEREVARAATVVGDEFCASDVQPLVEGSAPGLNLGEYLDDLAEAQLTVLLETGVDPHYAFHHGLIREMIYGSLPFARRRELHSRMAAFLEARSPCDPMAESQGLAALAELLAHHYGRAGEVAAAAFYLLLSGHKARQRYAYAQAAGLYRRAEAALAELPPQELDADILGLLVQAREAQGDVALLGVDFTAAAAAYAAAAVVLAGEHVIQYDRPRLLLKEALVLPTQGQVEEAISRAREAWSARQPEQDPAAAAILAWLLWRTGSGESGEWLERATALVGLGGDPWVVSVAALLAGLGRSWAAAVEAYVEADCPANAAMVLCRQGDESLASGEVAAALACYDQAVGLWQQEDDAAGLALARYRQAEARQRQGDVSRAGALLQESLNLLAGPAAEDADRQTVREALAVLESGRAAQWPDWRWQRYDDTLQIVVLFRPLV